MVPEKELVLVLGGARSGKSSWALRYVEERYSSYLFLATAEVHDEEMAERVRLHKESRGARWNLLEEPIEVSEVLRNGCGDSEAVLVDCLTIWLSNILLKMEEEDLIQYQEVLLRSLSERKQSVVLVSNEVGMGIVPEYPLGRRFRDLAGHLHQRIASMADLVILMVAGLPLYLKGNS